MSHLKRTEDGRVIMPTFPKLQAQINAAKEEINFLNKEIIPALRERGLTQGTGINCKLILTAAESHLFLPELPKKSLQFKQYIGFNNKVCYFKEEQFMFAYDLTQDGKDRLAAINEFEELPERLQISCVIER